MVGVDGNQVTDLAGGHLPHGQVGGRQVHNFIVNLGLEMTAENFSVVSIITLLGDPKTTCWCFSDALGAMGGWALHCYATEGRKADRLREALVKTQEAASG